MIFIFAKLDAQILNGLKDKLNSGLNNAANNAKNNAKIKARQKAFESYDKKLAKSRAEFDASNFNYAISFSDNSALFETAEKGSRTTSYMQDLREVKSGESEAEKKYDRAYMLNSQGEVWMASNNNWMARKSFLGADSMYKQIDSIRGLEYGQVMNNIGLLFQSTNRLNQAEGYINKAIEVRSAILPKGAMTAVSLNNKAVLMKDLGRYNESELFFDKAMAMQKDTLGEKNLGYALMLNNKAMLYQATGKNEKAVELMLKSLEISKEILKETSSNYLKLSINLAILYREMKKYDESEKIYLNAIKVKERKLGIFHPDFAHLKRGLAELYLEMGRLDEVEKNLNTAIDIYTTKLGAEAPATLATKNDLGNFFRITGKKDKALQLLGEVEKSSKTVYGENHPAYVKVLEDLAIAQWENEKITEASANYSTVIKKTNEYIQNYFSALSESEKTKFWDKTTPRFNRFNSFCAVAYEKDPTLLDAMFNNQLNTKALLLNSSSKVRNLILASGDKSLINDYNDWLAVKENLGRYYSMSKKEIAEEHVNLDSMEMVSDKLEKKLSLNSSLFGEATNGEAVDLGKVRAALKADEAAVEIIRIDKYDVKFTSDVYYAALIISGAGTPQLVLMKNGKEMEGNSNTEYRKNILDMKADNVSCGIFWDPIEAKLAGKKKIYVSLDGVYNQVSLYTLKDATGKYLIDKHNIVIVGNSKDIIKIVNAPKIVLKKTASLVGNPNYGSNDIIAALPGTKTEVENVKKTLSAAKYKTELIMQDEATEEKVKSLHAEVLHIATHGFFLADLNDVESDKVLGVETSTAKKNPLLRSGLMLANCEKVFDETGAQGNTNNGILTAYEVMNLSLEGTDLVVLSACQTGLGDIKSGEGVYGLQRSFLVAGARSVIMSLWEVSDDATMELMTEFYKIYSATGNKQEAFLSAEKKIKIKYKEPFFWGAFVLIGN
ncbi:MAG: CHAT domain-containing protein [Bacteroidia bacterium]|nr:CHAT domain-containing protein [Bacteroidia bacterium]